MDPSRAGPSLPTRWSAGAHAYCAQTRLTDGGTEDLAGVSVLRFGADGLVVEERDFWAQG
jgi:hypothetical protein